MKHNSVYIPAQLLCTLIACVCTCVLILAPATAGEFGATFNSRLTCEYSSWHEGKVVRVAKDYITIALVRDLLRHAPEKIVRIRNYVGQHKGPSKGDSVLVYYHRKHPIWVRHSQCPASLEPGPHLMGKIDRVRDEVISGGWNYQSPMLTWFYRSGRWDARVISEPQRPHGYAWYAQLPGGKRYLIYDETDPKRPAQYIVHNKPYKSSKHTSKVPWILLTSVSAATFLLIVLAVRTRTRR